MAFFMYLLEGAATGDGPNGLPDDIFIGIHHEIWPGSTPLAPHGA
jgi:hypothetical protein